MKLRDQRLPQGTLHSLKISRRNGYTLGTVVGNEDFGQQVIKTIEGQKTSIARFVLRLASL